MSESGSYYSDLSLPGRILLVDDEHLIRKTLKVFLERNGYTVETAEDGGAAIRALETSAFDLVITDLRMPGVDGRELLRVMSDRFKNIPRIVLTAVDSSADILLALKTGADDFITKPIVDFSFFNHTIQRALERKKLNEDRQRALIQMEKVNEIISMLNRGLDTSEIFRIIDISLKQVLPFNRMILFAQDYEHHSLSVKLATSDRKMMLLPGQTFLFDETGYASLSRGNDVFVIDDLCTFIEKNTSFNEFKLLAEEGILSGIMMELVFNEKRWGYLFFGADAKEVFDEEHARFLRLIAGQISLGIHRGELLTELEIHTKHLEHLVKVRTYEVLKTQKTTIFALSKLAETRDTETGDHLHRMRNYCILLAQLVKYSGQNDRISNQFLRDIYDSSILHDIGKVGIPDVILLKPGPLTPEEFEVIKKHTEIGYNALKDPSEELGENSFLDMAKDIILYHHERWDGKGYPRGLKGEHIPISARIVSIGDIYDALTTKRPYKEAMSHHSAVEIMKEESYRFDPFLLDLFLENHGDFDRIKRQFL
jgi:response regulator RpfG family c-di-GMP phosphodiesterase